MSRLVFGIVSILGLTLFVSDATAAYDNVILKRKNLKAFPLIEVKVYTESLCPDCRRFIRTQLFPAMINNGLLKFTDLKFVPYGKVKRKVDPVTQKTTLHCQHGNNECELNALHACIVEHNTVEEQLEMINCLMGNMWSNANIATCLSDLNINIRDAEKCKNTRLTPDILKKYGDDTDTINIKFVPSISIDGKFVPGDQDEILNNFSRIFCRKYSEKYGVKLPNCYIY